MNLQRPVLPSWTAAELRTLAEEALAKREDTWSALPARNLLDLLDRLDPQPATEPIRDPVAPC